MTTRTPMIEMRSVSKHFGSVIAISDISMQVYSGEVMCLLGDNGAGKSTLIKTLSGVHQPTHGEMASPLVSSPRLTRSTPVSRPFFRIWPWCR